MATKRTGRRPGRPSKMNPDNVRRVEEMKASGIADETIAGELHISRMTLLKHYSAALKTGRSRREAELNAIAWREARAGKSWAVKLLMEQVRAAGAHESFMSPEPDTPKPAKLGKKEQAQVAAQEAVSGGSTWGDDLMPGARPN